MTDVMVLVAVVDEEHARFGELGTVGETHLHAAAKLGAAGRLACRFPNGVEILGFAQLEIIREMPGRGGGPGTESPRRG